MTRFLSLFFATLLTALAGSLFVASSAKAASPYDNAVRLTDSIVLKDFNDNTKNKNYNFNWYSEALAASDLSCQASVSFACDTYDKLNNLLNDESNDWAVIVDDDQYSFQIIFSLSPGAYMDFPNHDELYVYPGSGEVIYRTPQFIFDSDPGVFQQHYVTPGGTRLIGNLISSFDSIGLSASYGSTKIFISTFTITYPEGYAGLPIPSQESEMRKTPGVMYRVDEDLNLWATYMRNIDDTITNQILSRWRIYEAGQDYEMIGEPVIDKEQPSHSPFDFQLSMQGNYILRVNFRAPIPMLPLDDSEVRTELFFHINANGIYQIGGTFHGSCEDGVCVAPAIDCSLLSDPLGRLRCEMTDRFDYGLLNPSILAFTGLFTSFYVPAEPACNIPLPNVNLASGHQFPLSGYSSQVCTKATTLKQAFPLVVVVVNFVFAMLILACLAGVINKVTDNNKHRIVEGV